MHKRTTFGVVLVALAFAAQVRPVLAQDDRIQKIEQRLNSLEQRVGAVGHPFDFINRYLPVAFPIAGIGLFCGLWAGTPVATSGFGSWPGLSSAFSR